MSRFVRISLAAMAVAVLAVFVSSYLTKRQFNKDRNETELAMRGILFNLANWSSMKGRMPSTTISDAQGGPLSSWRFVTSALLLGDLAQTGFYGQHAHVDKSWQSIENRRFLSGPFREYMGSPSSYIDSSRSGNKARFVAICGPGTAFDDDERQTLEQLPRNTLVVVETTGCQFHWMQPGGDLEISRMPKTIGAKGGIGPAFPNRTEFCVGFADLSVWHLRSNIPFESLARFFIKSEANRTDRESVLGQHAIQVWRQTDAR